MESNEQGKTEELLVRARDIARSHASVGDEIEAFRMLGGRTNMSVYQNDGESFNLFDVTGEISAEFLSVEVLDVEPDPTRSA